jgi:hypothetical protein
MFKLYRNEWAMAAATFAGAFAVATAAETGGAAADPTWSITMKNTSGTSADVSIMVGGNTVGKATVGARGSATITVPAKLGTFSWKAENNGKECGRHEVDLIRSKTFDVACNPSPTASTSSQPKAADSSSQSQQTSGGGTSGATPKPLDIRLKSLSDYQKKIDDAEADLKQINAKLANTDKLPVAEYNDLTKKADEDIKTINNTKAILGDLKSVIETNSSNTLPALPKVSANGTDGGAEKAISDFIARHKLCHPAGDASKDVSSNDGKHAISCKIER